MQQIIMYSRKDCPNCENLVEQLDKLGIVYTKVMVDTNYKVKAKLLAGGFDSVPVLSVGDLFISGGPDILLQAAVDLNAEKQAV